MTSFYCSSCVIAWAPYMCTDGACPVCGSGTVRRQEPQSPEAQERHQAALRVRIARERSEHNHRLFEQYYAEREANAQQPTEAIDTEAILRALAFEATRPEQHGEVDLGEAA